jgi:hypothetical protein
MVFYWTAVALGSWLLPVPNAVSLALTACALYAVVRWADA